MLKEKIVMSKDYSGHIQTVLRNGVCIYRGKTEQQYINEGYQVVTEEEFEIVRENYLNGICNKWEEISEDQFEEMLNVLPPMRWSNGGFFMSEVYTADVTSFYQQVGDKYYTSNQRLSYKRQDILDNLKQFITQ